MDRQEVTLLVLIDLSAAFDTIDHAILLETLEKDFGVTGNALKWLTSYLSERKQTILIKDHESEVFNLQSGVPQGNAKQIDGQDTKKETDLSKMARKGTVMKTLGSDRIQKSPKLPSPSEVKVPSKESTTISHSSETKWQNDHGKTISSLENRIFHQIDLREKAKREKFASLTTQHLRNKREEKYRPISKEYTQEDLVMCNDSIINIKYDEKYNVWDNFSILYKNKVYDYTEYRVLNDSIKICNSTDNNIRNIWKEHNKWVKRTMHYKCSNKPIHVHRIPRKFYIVRKDFSVLILPIDQVIAKYDYDVFEVKCNTLMKSDENKWKTFLKYSVFSWGVPLIITIVYIVLVKKDVLRIDPSKFITTTSCVMGNELPLWLAGMEKYGLRGCLLLYIIAMFSFTAYRIRQKLKASSSIAQKSNIVKKRNSFVVLLKLSTTTSISLFPLLFENMHFDRETKMGLFTVANLSGVYIGIAFVFTRKNYRLLKKKYFPAIKHS
ncbi:Hypothetical predicted protein [Paramuricea clavata]|uniref:Uncharacterized protein n=1 Tax=Paramuricea clavata TaxID=317549 RepID=A0A7D9HZT3_PARCT|nr:Hypothetical predicted protein [Paramuricea clavata]